MNITVHRVEKTQAAAMATKLRELADLLDSFDMTWVSGGLVIQPQGVNDVKVMSDLVLRPTQPAVVEATDGPDIDLYSNAETDVFETLVKIEPGATEQLSFDLGEYDEVEEWVGIARDRGRYPTNLVGRVFDVKRTNNATGYVVIVHRVL